MSARIANKSSLLPLCSLNQSRTEPRRSAAVCQHVAGRINKLLILSPPEPSSALHLNTVISAKWRQSVERENVRTNVEDT